MDIRYCLYARKSSEDDERQALSIDSQIKEMTEVARREKLNITEIRKESHSAKASGQRSVFNQLIQDVRSDIFSGVIAWAPDRLSRNAGDLGSIVDLMDQGLLHEIRTQGQTFTNSPNDKFLLMILCSQAKLENDNRRLNVKRGLKNKAEMGLRPCSAPLGYLHQYVGERNKGTIIVDPDRAPIIKQMFIQVAERCTSGRTLLRWLNDEIKFTTRTGKPLALSGIYRILNNPFYYGEYEYPTKSGSWYKGKHEPLITKSLFNEVQAQLVTSPKSRPGSKEFNFTKMIRCGSCGAGITAEEHFKNLKDGGVRKYIYYHCTQSHLDCKQPYIREDTLLEQLLSLVDNINLNDLGIKEKIEAEILRLQKFSDSILGLTQKIVTPEIDVRLYAKYILKEGTREEKRELLGSLKSRLYLETRRLRLK